MPLGSSRHAGLSTPKDFLSGGQIFLNALEGYRLWRCLMRLTGYKNAVKHFNPAGDGFHQNFFFFCQTLFWKHTGDQNRGIHAVGGNDAEAFDRLVGHNGFIADASANQTKSFAGFKMLFYRTQVMAAYDSDHHPVRVYNSQQLMG